MEKQITFSQKDYDKLCEDIERIHIEVSSALNRSDDHIVKEQLGIAARKSYNIMREFGEWS
jgi:hypothetical protein